MQSIENNENDIYSNETENATYNVEKGLINGINYLGDNRIHNDFRSFYNFGNINMKITTDSEDGTKPKNKKNPPEKIRDKEKSEKNKETFTNENVN